MKRSLRLPRLDGSRRRGRWCGYLEAGGWLAESVLVLQGWLTAPLGTDLGLAVSAGGLRWDLRALRLGLPLPDIDVEGSLVVVRLPLDGEAEPALLEDVAVAVGGGWYRWLGAGRLHVGPTLAPLYSRGVAAGTEAEVGERLARFLFSECPARLGIPDGDRRLCRNRDALLRLLPRSGILGRSSYVDVEAHSGLGLDQVLPLDRRRAFAVGWLWDPEGKGVALEVEADHSATSTVTTLQSLVRVRRPDVTESLGEGQPAAGGGPRLGFVSLLALPDSVFPRPRLRARLRLDYGLGPQIDLPLDPLGDPFRMRQTLVHIASQFGLVDLESLATVVAPALDALSERCRESLPPVKDEIFGAETRGGRVSVLLVLRTTAGLEGLFAEIADDPYVRRQEIVVLPQTPELAEELAERLPDLVDLFGLSCRLIHRDRKTGWTETVAAGVEQSRGEHLLIADGAVLPKRAGWLETMVGVLRGSRRVGLVAPRILASDGAVSSAGLTHGRPGPARCRPVLQPRSRGLPPMVGDAAAAGAVVAVDGTCFLVRREALVEAGGLDDGYLTARGASADLSLRCCARGYETWYLPAAELFVPEEEGEARADADWPTVYDDWRLRRRIASASDGGASIVAADRAAVTCRRPPRPPVSVVIPTRDAGAGFSAVLEAVSSQRFDGQLEILVLDSASSDGTRERALRHGARLIDVCREGFDHGETRSRGIQASRGELVVLLSQDARPADDRWLEALVAGFEDPSLAGSYSRQIPREDAHAVTRARLERWIASATTDRVSRVTDAAAFLRQPGFERLRLATFDNVASCVRRDVALAIPFRRCRFAEDLDWSCRVLGAGHSIAFASRSVVVHSHERSAWYELRRTYLAHQQLQRLLGLCTVADLRALCVSSWSDTLWQWRVIAGAVDLSPGARIGSFLRSPAMALALALGQYLGAASVAGLRDHRRSFALLDGLLAHGV